MTEQIFKGQREFFASGSAADIRFRIDKLKLLRRRIYERSDEITAAIREDTGRHELETFTSEVYTVISELDLAIKNLRKWARPERARTPLMLRPGRSRILCEPYGVVLIFAPWNYPFQLVMAPLTGAVAAGNCAVVKPSEYAPRSAALTEDIIEECFEPGHVRALQGGKETAESLLQMNFDYIFFTGGAGTGRRVMRAAAERLTPVTLELGGKCPCIVAQDADIVKASRRIAWGKFFNAGQTCLAPDYVLAQDSIKDVLVKEIRKRIEEFYGYDPSQSPDYARIINERHFDRLLALLDSGSELHADRTRLYMPPALIENADADSELMKQEIFGPLLPVLGYSGLKDALEYIKSKPKPLAVYVFASDARTADSVISGTSSGGVTVNDVLIQAASCYLPFGGVGRSGMGRYRGKSSFLTFSNRKSVMSRGMFPDWRFRYPPYPEDIKKIKKIFRFL